MEVTWTKISTVLIGISLIIGTTAAVNKSWDSIVPWVDKEEFAKIYDANSSKVEREFEEIAKRNSPSREEFQVVASRSCDNKISSLQRQMWSAETALFEAEKSGNTQWANTLRNQIKGLKSQIAAIKRKCRS